MTVLSGSHLPVATSHATARQRKLQRLLRSYGVLTHDDLRELAHAGAWQVPFETVLRNAIASGRVRQLSDDLYEAADGRPPT
jgi:hypothetical protein